MTKYKEDEIMIQMRKEAEEKHFPIMRESLACFMDIVIRTTKPRNILEIGTCIGYSSLVMYRAMAQRGRIVTIEIDYDLVCQARNYFKMAGADEDIFIYNGDAEEILEYMDGEFDIIFMDGPKGQYCSYLTHCLRLLKPGGLLICDDVLFYGMVASDKIVNKKKGTIVREMKKFLNTISNHSNLSTIIIPLGDGISISYKKEDKARI